MPLYKRGQIWWIRFTTPGGELIRESTGTTDKVAAQEYHDQRKVDAWRIAKLSERPKYLWEEAVLRWLEERSHKKSIEDDKHHLKRLDRHLAGRQLHTIDRALIDTITRSRQADGVTNATVNRTLEVLRAILRAAEREWDWIDRAPHVRMLQEPKRRIRWITHEEAARLLAELPSHLADMANFSLQTGLREANVCGLTWSQIDLGRAHAWKHHDETKTGGAIPLPLNEVAMEILTRRLGQHPTHVFTYKGNPVSRANNHAWRKALQRSGIEDFRWHDLRHTWATWHRMNGTPLHVLQELGAWESEEMVRRYAHFSADHLAEHVNNINRGKRSN